eukprot:2688596-Rhodomonas_salina.2
MTPEAEIGFRGESAKTATAPNAVDPVTPTVARMGGLEGDGVASGIAQACDPIALPPPSRPADKQSRFSEVGTRHPTSSWLDV